MVKPLRKPVMTLRLADIWDLALHYVPPIAADPRLRDCGPCSWWPAHEIGHFLIATSAECTEPRFGIDTYETETEINERRLRYVIAKEIAATSISQRLLRRSGHAALADEEIQYTDENTLECSFERWCKRAVTKLLRANKVACLSTTRQGLEARLSCKAREVGTPPACPRTCRRLPADSNYVRERSKIRRTVPIFMRTPQN